MKAETKRKLFEAWQYCDDYDKSTEFMLQYMQDVAKVDLDCVISFLQKTTDEARLNFNRSNSDPYGGLGSEMDTNSMNYNNLKL
ncbi:MAG: hypothetical protein JJE45_00430 [Prolixibacteraceae bacterium]|nr:hypothetical protein [Prolixibacteraceae bacterium]